MDIVYSRKFKEIISDAPRQAARHNSRYVMPEHLLLSLLTGGISSSSSSSPANSELSAVGMSASAATSL